MIMMKSNIKRFIIKSFFLIFLIYSMPAFALHSTYTRPLLSAIYYARNELLKAGWHQETTQAIITVNGAWFTFLKETHENDFYKQINLLKQLGHSAIINRFLRQHPETAGLLALSDDPIQLIKILRKTYCYNILTSFYAIYTTVIEVQLLTQALEKHRDLMCHLAKRGILGIETIFIFPRQTKGAKEYDAWLERVFSKYLQHSDEQLAEIIAFLIENGQNIRQRLNKDPHFYNDFRKKLWPALMRVVDHFGAFEWLANDPYIWDLLALKEGELLLNKWGLGPISLLFGEGSYPLEMRPIIIQMLLQGDDNTVEALFRYKDEPLFRQLMYRPLSTRTQTALANQLVKVCPNYPEQVCPDLPHHLRYFSSITDNAALAEEVGVLSDGPITWIPFHGSYYAFKKMSEGREVTTEDIINMGLDALIFIPSALFAKPFSQAVQPLGKELILNIGVIGLEGLTFTPYPYHLVKPLGKFAIRTGNRTSKILNQHYQGTSQTVAIEQGTKIILPSTTRQVAAVMKQNQHILNSSRQKLKKQISYEVTEPILFLHEKAGHRGRYAMRVVDFEAKIFIRHDAKVVMTPTRCAVDQFFQETAERALSTPTTRFNKRKVSAWQQNISAWWLINAAVAP